MARPHEPGVPLAHYRQHNAGLRLTCLNCMLHRDLELEAVIARLEARGVGGAQTGIRAAAALVTEPCKRCGAMRYESAPAWLSPQTQKPPRPAPGG